MHNVVVDTLFDAILVFFFVFVFSFFLSSVMDHCYDSPCQNNGTCHNLSDNYTCGCPMEFTGHNCGGLYYICRNEIHNYLPSLSSL